MIALNLKSNQVSWSTKLPGIAISTPVYSYQKKIFYVLVQTVNPNYKAYKVIALTRKGKITDQFSVDLLTLYRKNNPKITKDQLNSISFRTALGINEINQKHYIFLATSTSRNPYGKGSLRTPYAKYRGATGMVLGIYVDNKAGHFSKQNPLIFFTSKIKKHPMTGYNTGIYLAGGAINLLNNNTLIVPTGNGPSYPEEGNYGCSLVRLDGSNLKPLKGTNGFEYLSNDQDGFQECLASNVEFASGYPNIIKTKKGNHIGLIRDKHGSLFIFDPEALAGNKSENRNETPAYEFVNKALQLCYSGGSLFEKDGQIHGLAYFNSLINKGERKIFTTLKTADKIPTSYYEKKRCVGLLKREGLKKNQASLFTTGSIERLFTIFPSENKEISSVFKKDTLIKKYYPKSIEIVENFKIPYQKVTELGYTPLASDIPPKGYTHSYFKIWGGNAFSLEREEFRLFIEKEKPADPSLWKELDFKLHFLKDQNMTDRECSPYNKNQYTEVWEFVHSQAKASKTFHLRAMNIDKQLKAQEMWMYHGEKNEIIDKNSLVTIFTANQKKYLTLFNARNIQTNDSFVYIIDTIKGKKIKKYPIKGSLHFSSVLPVDSGIIVPSKDNGIIYLKLDPRLSF